MKLIPLKITNFKKQDGISAVAKTVGTIPEVTYYHCQNSFNLTLMVKVLANLSPGRNNSEGVELSMTMVI
jgi:hypothetical protein